MTFFFQILIFLPSLYRSQILYSTVQNPYGMETLIKYTSNESLAKIELKEGKQ